MTIQPRQNYQMTVADGMLIIEIILDESQVDTHLSASGKSVILATTSGNIPVPGTALKLGLNVYRAA